MSNRLLIRDAPPPTVAVELAAHRVSAAALEFRGGRPVVVLHATEPLPEGALVPSLVAPNILGRTVVAEALARVLDHVGRPRRIGLVLPDPVAKVSLIRFGQLPARIEDLDQLVKWQVRKAAPFPIDEAQVSYVAGARAVRTVSPGNPGTATPGHPGMNDEGHEFVVTVARRSVIQEYETLCAEAGAYAGLVDISTFNVINALLAGSAPPQGDWLLVNVATDYASLAILRQADLIVFRSRGVESDEKLTDLVHQTAMYYEDRLQGTGFTQVLLSGASLHPAADVDEVRRNLQERLGTAVETVDARGAAALTDRITAAPALLDTLAPLVGLLLRDRGAAA